MFGMNKVIIFEIFLWTSWISFSVASTAVGCNVLCKFLISTNSQHSSVAPHFKSIDFVVYCLLHIHMIPLRTRNIGMLMLLLRLRISLFPESNLCLVYSLCYFCLTLSCMLYCCSQVFVLLDLCKPLSFYIYLTLFLRCFLYDHCFSLHPLSNRWCVEIAFTTVIPHEYLNN